VTLHILQDLGSTPGIWNVELDYSREVKFNGLFSELVWDCNTALIRSYFSGIKSPT
jgi:hypothetical protein